MKKYVLVITEDRETVCRFYETLEQAQAGMEQEYKSYLSDMNQDREEMEEEQLAELNFLSCWVTTYDNDFDASIHEIK